MDRTLLNLGGGELELQLAPLGARVHRLRATLADGTWRDVVLSLPRIEDYLETEGFLGATVGRVANRIEGASFALDGVEYALSANEGPHTLHGGADGFDRRSWRVLSADDNAAELELVSPDGDQGFPGNVVARARFEVTGRELRTTYVATTDAPTPVSMTSHAYYRLDDGPTVLDHELTVHADAYLPVDAELIPTGKVESVAGTPYDLTQGRTVASLVADLGGLDHSFVLRGEGLREVARLRGGGLCLTLSTDQPQLQVYTGGVFDGRPHPRWAGVALEPQLPPDALHRPDWDSPVLRPGEEYRWHSVVRVEPDGLADDR